MSASGFCTFCNVEKMAGMLIDTDRGPTFICYDCADEVEWSFVAEMSRLSTTEALSPEEEPF